MKRILTIILAAALCLSLIAGCGGTTSGTGSASATSTGTSASSGTAATSGTESSAKVYSVAFAHASAEDTSGHKGFLAIKDYLEKSGRFTVALYPNGQLGADREAIEGTQNGDITGTLTSPAPQANFVDAIQIYDVPFACLNIDAARKLATDEEFLSQLREAYAAKGFYLGFLCDMSFRILTTRDLEVHTPDDLKGFNVRTMENANHMLIWSTLGANPTPIAFTELYTALQQGTVDGQENALELAVTQKFYEQQHYANMTNHLVHCNALPINLEWYNSLDDDARAIFDEALEVGRLAIAENVDSTQQYYRDFCNEHGCKINDLTNDELLVFRDKTAVCYDAIQKKLTDAGCGGVYDRFMEVIKSFA